MNLIKIKICTIISVLLDIAALAIICWMGTQAVNIVFWTCLAIFASFFVFDIRNAIRFYKNVKRNN